jgi:alkaline phosphatase
MAENFLASGVDFFAGGGLRHFILSDYGTDTKDYTGATIKSKREDSRNLVEEFAAKEGTDADTEIPSIAEMTDKDN